MKLKKYSSLFKVPVQNIFDMLRKTIICFGFLLIIVLIAGCTQNTQYVCPDGKTVSDPNLCSTQCVSRGGDCAEKTCCAGLTCLSGVCIEQSESMCGNGVCNTGESCTSCPADCGSCPTGCSGNCGILEFKGDSITSKDFWHECLIGCFVSSPNNFYVQVKKIQDFDRVNPRAEFLIWVDNQGSGSLENITTEISCFENTGSANISALSDAGTYKGIELTKKFICTSCRKSCVCSEEKATLDAGDTIQFTIETKVKNVSQNVMLWCDVTFNSEYPVYSKIKRIFMDFYMI